MLKPINRKILSLILLIFLIGCSGEPSVSEPQEVITMLEKQEPIAEPLKEEKVEEVRVEVQEKIQPVVTPKPLPAKEVPISIDDSKEMEEEDEIDVEIVVETFSTEEEFVPVYEPPKVIEIPSISKEKEEIAEMRLPGKRPTLDRGIQQGVFIPKGLWMVGGTFSYTEANMGDYKLLVLKNMEGSGYTFSVSPAFCYFFMDNVGVGGRFTYSRDMIDIGNMDINLNEDLSFAIDNAYLVEHMFYGTAFLRTYTTIGNSRIIALFNEARITYGAGQGKTFSGQGESLDGLYQNMHRLQIGMSPGIAAFITNSLAIDVSVGVVGFDTKWIRQDHNKVIQGNYRTSSAKFNVDLFSINLGLAYYF